MADLNSTASCVGGCGSSSSVQKAICTICFEDLKPIVEELQTLPVCGHVFHELCIQQWFEYCPAGKKPTCPVCKQSCSRQKITRLYFQSTGDSSQLSSSVSTQVPSNANAQALAEQVRKLEGKLAVLTTTFEIQQVHLKKLEEELYASKQLAKREELKKDELKKEKENSEQLLYKKMEELSIKTAECAKLQERSLALAKELAALKLATDLNLEEEDMVKLASIGHGNNIENAVDVLKKSLARRNKSYKELMIQCNVLGRSESRACKKLDMAKEMINKLKVRLQELEKVLEEKENEVLRVLKASSTLNSKQVNLSNIKQSVRCPTLEDQSVGQCAVENSDLIANSDCLSEFCKAESTVIQKISYPSTSKKSKHPFYPNAGSFNHNIDVDSLTLISESNGHPSSAVKPDNEQAFRDGSVFSGIRSSFIRNAEAQTFTEASGGAVYCNFENDTKAVGESAPIFIKRKSDHMIDMKDTVKILTDAIQKEAPSISGKQETQVFESLHSLGSPSLSSTGPELESKSTGRWCRQIHSRPSTSGDLIVVGADGRGGRIKVLKSQEFLEGSKKLKHGAMLRSQFNIEHFFEKKQTG